MGGFLTLCRPCSGPASSILRPRRRPAVAVAEVRPAVGPAVLPNATTVRFVTQDGPRFKAAMQRALPGTQVTDHNGEGDANRQVETAISGGADAMVLWRPIGSSRFADMTRHDIDLARFVMGVEVTEVSAIGAEVNDTVVAAAAQRSLIDRRPVGMSEIAG